MPIEDRDYVRGKHPPACTCKECTDKRLGKFRSQAPHKRRAETQKTRSNIRRAIVPPRFLQRIWWKIPPSVIKLILSLLIIAGLVDIVRRGYLLFTQRTDPIKNTVIFLVEVALWFWIAAILRRPRYRYRNPKFKLTFIVVLAIVLVCTFAGIQPLSSYKDNLFTSIGNYLEERRLEREAATKAAEEARIKAEEAAQAEAARKAVEETEAAAEQRVKNISEMERTVVELVNGLRADRGVSPLLWDDQLYAYSKKHSEDMAMQKSLFHSSIDEPYAENAWGGEGSTSWTATTIVNSWMSSPMHRTWLLCPRLRHIAVGICISDTGMYASWTFWRNEPLYEDWWYQEGTDPPDWWY